MKKILTLLTVLLSALVLTSCNTIKPDEHFTIVFYMGGLSKIDTVEVDKGSVYARPTDPESDYGDFVDWYQEPGLVNVFDFSKPLTKSATIYAKWDYFMYNIEYELGEGGVNNTNNPTTIQKFRLIERDATFSLQAPSKEGMIFRSWHFEPDFSDSPIVNLNKNNITQEVTTIYARWRTTN